MIGIKLQWENTYIIKYIFVFLAPIILYWRLFFIVFNEAFNNEMASYILVLPFLLFYILYRIRKTVIASASQQSSNFTHKFIIKDIIGISLCVIAYFISLYGSYSFHSLEINILSLPIFVAGIIILIFNIKTFRILLFPVFLLIFLIPLPFEIVQLIGSILSVYSSKAVFILLKFFKLAVSFSNYYDNPIITLINSNGKQIQFAIDLACSGFYSLTGFTIFAIFLAYIYRISYKKKIIIFLLGFPLIYSLNIFRITLIVLIGYYFGLNYAMNIFHLMGGWILIFFGTLLLLTITNKVLKLQSNIQTSEVCLHHNKNEEKNYCLDCGKILIAPLSTLTRNEGIKLLFILAILFSTNFLQVPIVTLTKGEAEVLLQKSTGEQTIASVLPEIEDYAPGFVYRDVAFENISKQDASLMYRYQPKNRSKSTIWVGFEIGQTKYCLHPWEVCLISWPQEHGWTPRVVQLCPLDDIHLIENPPLSARFFAFKDKGTNVTQAVLYWYTKTVVQMNKGFQEKWVKISVIKFDFNPNDYISVENELLFIAKAIVEYWLPITTWSSIALLIAKKGLTLIIMTGAFLLCVIMFYFYLERSRRRIVNKIYSNIPIQKEQQILDSIKKVDKDIATEHNILRKFYELTGYELSLDELRAKLDEAENSGLIERKITSINDEPYISWKPNF